MTIGLGDQQLFCYLCSVVCLCFCWSRLWAVRKRMNRSRCPVWDVDPGGRKEPCALGGIADPPREAAPSRNRILGHIETCPRSTFSTIFARGQERCGCGCSLLLGACWTTETHGQTAGSVADPEDRAVGEGAKRASWGCPPRGCRDEAPRSWIINKFCLMVKAFLWIPNC